MHATTTPCLQEYRNALTAVRSTHLARGLEQKIVAKLDNAWRKYASLSKNGPDQAMREVQNALDLLDGNATKQISPAEVVKLRNAITSFLGCLKSTPNPGSATVTVTVKVQESATSVPVSAGSGVAILVGDEPIATTGADGKATFAVIPGPAVITAHRAYTTAGSASIDVASGQTLGVDIIMTAGKQISERSDVEVAQIPDGVLPSTFTTVSLQFSRDGAAVPMSAIGSVFLEAPGALLNVSNHFAVGTAGDVRLIQPDAFRAFVDERLDPFVLRVHAVDKQGKSYYESIPFTIGRHVITGSIAAPAGTSGVSRAGVYVVATHTASGMTFRAVSDAGGSFRFDGMPEGAYHFTADAIQNNRIYSGSADAIVRANAAVSVALRGADDYVADPAPQPYEGNATGSAPDHAVAANGLGAMSPAATSLLPSAQDVRSVLFQYANGVFTPLGHFRTTNPRPLESAAEEEIAEAISAAASKREASKSRIVVRAYDRNGVEVFHDIVEAPRRIIGSPRKEDSDRRPSDAEMLEQLFIVRVPVETATITVQHGWITARHDLDQLERDPSLRFHRDAAERGTTNVVRANAYNNPFLINVVITGDGFTKESDFNAAASKVARRLVGLSPYKEYSGFFTFRSHFVASPEDGIDRPHYKTSCAPGEQDCCTDRIAQTLGQGLKNTRFHATFCNDPAKWYLLGLDWSAVFAELLSRDIPFDQVIVVGNTPEFGGTALLGGDIAIVTNDESTITTPHEIGHSFAGLADEYPETGSMGCSDAPGQPFRCPPNVTDQTDRYLIKWREWILPTTQVPWPEEFGPEGVVSAFPVTSAKKLYRPESNCVMRSSGATFCHVCGQELVLSIWQYGGLIDAFEPSLESDTPIGVDKLFRVYTTAPYPRIDWYVNGELKRSGPGTAFLFNPPLAGRYRIEAKVMDESPYVHPSKRSARMEKTLTWTLDATVQTQQTATIRSVGVGEQRSSTALRIPPGVNSINLRYAVTTTETDGRSDAYGVALVGRNDVTREGFRIIPDISGQIAAGQVIDETRTIDITQFQDADGVTLELYVTAQNLNNDANNPTTVTGTLSFAPLGPNPCTVSLENCPGIVIESVTAEPLDASFTKGDSTFYSIPRTGETNVFHRSMIVKIRQNPATAPVQLDVTVMSREPATPIANVRTQTLSPAGSQVQSIRVTFDQPMQGGTGLPVTYDLRYRFRARVTIEGLTSESVYDVMTVKAGDPPGVEVRDRQLHALWHMPSQVARFGVREIGGDDWITRGAYAWLRDNAHLLPPVDDLSGEHARDLGHADHQYGSDIDIAHFPFGFTPPPPEMRFSVVRESLRKTLTGNFTIEDRDNVVNWVGATREGLRNLFFERIGGSYIPRTQFSNAVATIVLPRGEQCQTDISRPEIANWAQRWVINGEVPGIYQAGPPLNQTPGFAQYPDLISRLAFECDRSDRITIKLNRCGIGSEGPCGGRRRAVAPSRATVPPPPPVQFGASATLRVSVAEGEEPLMYRWYQGRSGDTTRPVPNGNGVSITVSPVETSDYWVSVINYIGSTSSNTATVTVIQPCTPIAVTEEPASSTIVRGQAATLRVSTTGSDPRRYTWFSSTAGGPFTVVPFGGGASLFVAPQDTTSYRVEIVNGCGVVRSATATITVKPPCVPAAIAAQPQQASIIEGQSATLTVGATGTALQYQWYESALRNGPFSPVGGGNDATLVVAPLTTTYYLARISGECGQAESVAVAVTVTPACKPPAINAQPTSRSITEGEAVTLIVSATGTAPQYQWFVGQRGDTSAPIAAATSSSLTVTPLDTTSYWVRVSNDCGTVDSATAAIVVTPACTAPAITQQPQGGTINPGQTLTLTASATGSSVSYQWFAGVAGDTSSPVIGATTATLIVSPDSSTRYWMRALNTCGIADTVSVLVTVTPACVAPAITGAPQSTSIVEGQVATLTVSATGTSLQYQWFAGPVGDVSSPVSGGTSSSVAVSPGGTSSYWCRVSNECGSVMSPAATVTVSQSCTAPAVPSSTRAIDSAEAGASVTFEVIPTGGTAPLQYQWFASSPSGSPFVAMPGQTQRSITVAPTATSQYFLRVSNACGTDDSGAITVIVPPPTTCNDPSITQQPQSQSVPTGSTAVLTVSSTGTLPLSYRWYVGDSGDTSQPVANSNNATLVVTVNADTRRWVRITNSCGSVDSVTATLDATTSCSSPSIFSQPESVAIAPGQSTTLSVGASGTGPLRYQWFFGNGTPLSGASSSSVTVTPTQTTDFYVVVSNDCGSRASATATVTVASCVAPRITTQPQSQTVPYNGTVHLSVVATGQAPLSYRWYNGQPGDTTAPIYQNGQLATGSSVTFPAGTLFTTYWVRVSNACGSVDSAGAEVTMLWCVNISITQQPQSVTIDAGDSATLSVAATGDTPSYQWYRGSAGDTSSPISGATSSSVEVSPASTTSYWVRVSNACGTTFSATATVTVTSCTAPFITNQPPQQVTISAGDDATLSVGAGGSSPLTYQWYFSDSNQPVAAPGSSGTLHVSPSQTTTYYVVVRNECGETSSNPVTVNIVAPCTPPAVTSPSAETYLLLRIGNSKTLTVSANGSAPLRYQWFASAPEGSTFTAIPGATNASVTVSPFETARYFVRVSNDCGTVDSPQWRITVWDGVGDPPNPEPVIQ